MDNTKPSNPKDLVGIAKVPTSTVSQLVMMEVGLAMMEGALKYGRHNFRDVGVRASVYFDATQRHMKSWWEGQDIDPGSKLNHVTKAIASLTVLRDAMIMEMWEDDRPPKHPNLDAFIDDLNARAAELLKAYGEVNPEHITQVGQQQKAANASSLAGPNGTEIRQAEGP